eukprot:5116383-Amphidinium_carterae.1
MEPSSEEATSLHTLNDVIHWSEFPYDDALSLLEHLGLQPTMHWRVMAAMPSDLFQSSLSTWVTARDASPGAIAHAGILYQATRSLGGLP